MSCIKKTLSSLDLSSQSTIKGFAFDAVRGYNPSYTWASVLSYKWLIQRDACWIIGNKYTIKVWCDNWIPKAHAN